jgi:hypothetical protein
MGFNSAFKGLTQCTPPDLEDQGVSLVWNVALDLLVLEDAGRSYATTDEDLDNIALHKSHRHKAKTPSLGLVLQLRFKPRIFGISNKRCV